MGGNARLEKSGLYALTQVAAAGPYRMESRLLSGLSLLKSIAERLV
jgi:hypothetical protein